MGVGEGGLNWNMVVGDVYLSICHCTLKLGVGGPEDCVGLKAGGLVRGPCPYLL